MVVDGKEKWWEVVKVGASMSLVISENRPDRRWSGRLNRRTKVRTGVVGLENLTRLGDLTSTQR